MRLSQVLAAAGMIAISGSSASAQDVPTVAVIGITAFSVTLEDATALGTGLVDMFTTELSERPEVRAIDRQTLEEVLRRQQVSIGATGISDDAALQIGRMVGANFIVRGSAALDPRTARLDLRIVEVETSNVVRSVKESGPRENLLTLVEVIVDQLVSDLELPERPTMVQLTIPVAASLAYSRGLDYEQKGRRDRAAEMYRRALAAFPSHPHAQSALERVD